MNKNELFFDPRRVLLLFVSSNLLFLLLDVGLAHSYGPFNRKEDWYPLIFSFLGGSGALLYSLKRRPSKNFRYLFIGIMTGGVFIGLLGLFYHIQSALLVEFSLKSLVYAAPLVAPLSYTGICLVGLVADDALRLPRFSRQQVLFLLVGLGFFGNFILSVLDHARNGFFEPVEWTAVFVSLFGTLVLLGAFFKKKLTRQDTISIFTALILVALTGLLGFVFHLQADLNNLMPSWIDRFLYGAPIFAPLLFTDIAVLGFIALFAHKDQDVWDEKAKKIFILDWKNLGLLIASEPFRIFFPLGILYAFLGVLFWPLHELGILFENVTTKWHVWMMVYGFIFAFVFGFLATAIPRLTKTPVLKGREIGLLASLHTVAVICLVCQKFLLAHIVLFITMVTFIFLMIPRVQRRHSPLPASFIFLPFAFVSVLLGELITILIYMKLSWHVTQFYYLSKALIFQAFPVFLLLGVGGFLIRSILGWADNAEKKSKNYSRAFAVNTMIGAIILFAFFVESFYRPFSAGLIKALFVTIGFLYNMKIYRKPASDKITSRWLMFSMWLVIAGMWGQTLWPNHELAFLHLCFIGGFALAIICVATRVILNHGGYKRLLTGPSAMFSTAACFMTVGLFTRFIADFLPKTYSQHLTYAGTIWVLGLVVWSFFVMPKIIKKSREISS